MNTAARTLLVALSCVGAARASAAQQYRCTLADDTQQMADRDLVPAFPLAVKSCVAVAGSPATPERSRRRDPGQYRCILFDGSVQWANSDLARAFPMAVQSCRKLDVDPEPIIARSVDTPVDDVAVAVVERPAPAPASIPAAIDHARARPVASLIRAASLKQGLDPDVVSALVYVESRYNAAARSPKGALGLMQIMPATGARYGVHSREALLDPQVNIDVGTRYLRDLHRLFPGRTDLVLAAYNAGEGAVQRFGGQVPPFRETQAYVRQIRALSGGNRIVAVIDPPRR